MRSINTATSPRFKPTDVTIDSPIERYREALVAHGYSGDPAQETAITSLDRVWRDLLARPASGMLDRIRTRISGAPPEQEPVRGLYLWGGVGRGKTFLMDIFFHALPFDRKQRLHFHRFMQQVHGGLKTLKHTNDPLRIVAERLATKTDVICFDEFFVSDIADAMILGRLFENLFRLGVTLVATSNIPPDELYRDGLQRRRFLPAINAIKRHCEILNLDAGIDYRLRTLEKVDIYHWPPGPEVDEKMERYFDELNPDDHARAESLRINGRQISVRKLGDGVAWFDFSGLCEGPRSAADYIEIAREFHTVLLSDVPVMNWQRENDARRFITMVDEFYDRKVKLIISAELPAEQIYQGEKLHFEFRRTLSRLTEMQSSAYLSHAHLS